MSKAKEKSTSETPAQRHERFRVAAGRETVESIVVAIVLALLFRAFVAEAFVIPTGSMAPTLMGAHKDMTCLECGQPFQVGASIETKHVPQRATVVGSVCPNCGYLNPLDLAENSDHATFNGDRILVSKFAYALNDPERWDVIVFKFPGNPKQNYIKRLVGLPEETLRIRHGDVLARPHDANAFTVLRKPPAKLLAMAHHVHDTAYQSKSLIAAEYPTNWQPWDLAATSPPTDSWQISRDEESWTAQLETAPDQLRMLRYYHRSPSDAQWDLARQGRSLADVDPYSSEGITDFHAYDAYVVVDSNQVWDIPPGVPRPDDSFFTNLASRFRPRPGDFRRDYESGGKIDQFTNPPASIGQYGIADRGSHWVGDLILQADVETAASAGQLVLELVESAVTFRCVIDLSDGTARLEIIDIDGPKTFAEAGGAAETTPTAATGVIGGARHEVRLANCDDMLYLWVDGSPITFDQPTTFDMSVLRKPEEQRPYTQPDHPYDAAPAAVGVQGTAATIYNLQVMRDKYYIATQSVRQGLYDYDVRAFSLGGLRDSTGNVVNDIQTAITDPSLWDQHSIWESRRAVDFELDKDQFFPMGDNSPESQDARCWVQSLPSAGNVDPDAYLWAEASYVPRDLLVGKALIIFWPHTWNSPLPMTPNFRRMGFIR